MSTETFVQPSVLKHDAFQWVSAPSSTLARFGDSDDMPKTPFIVGRYSSNCAPRHFSAAPRPRSLVISLNFIPASVFAA